MLGNCCGWIIYSYILQNFFIFFANAPGFVLSVYYSLSAVKLEYEDHYATEMRRSFVNFLESSRRSSNVQHSTEVIHQEHDHNAWQKAKDLGKIVLQVTSQQTRAPAGQEKLVLGMVIIWLSVISAICFADWDTNTRQMVVGVIVNCNLLFFYGAPLSTILRVLKTRNSASIHIWTMVTNTLNGSFWTAYGLAVYDPFIWVSNGLGALLGVIQFFLCILFPRRRPTIANAGEEDEQGDVPAVELESFAAKEDTIEEGVSSSNSHESITHDENAALKSSAVEENELAGVKVSSS